jgi:hypothetical protein
MSPQMNEHCIANSFVVTKTTTRIPEKEDDFLQ